MATSEQSEGRGGEGVDGRWGGRGGEGTEVGMGEKYGGAREEGGGGGEGKGLGYEGVECLRVSRVRGEEAKESTVDGGGEGGKRRGETWLRGRRVASRKAFRRPLLSGTQRCCTSVQGAQKKSYKIIFCVTLVCDKTAHIT